MSNDSNRPMFTQSNFPLIKLSHPFFIVFFLFFSQFRTLFCNIVHIVLQSLWIQTVEKKLMQISFLCAQSFFFLLFLRLWLVGLFVCCLICSFALKVFQWATSNDHSYPLVKYCVSLCLAIEQYNPPQKCKPKKGKNNNKCSLLCT